MDSLNSTSLSDSGLQGTAAVWQIDTLRARLDAFHQSLQPPQQARQWDQGMGR